MGEERTDNSDSIMAAGSGTPCQRWQGDRENQGENL